MNPNLLRRTKLVYGLLLAVWVVIVGWQVMEHERVKAAARATLINRSKDITTTLGLVIRSQRRFWGGVSQERMESALNELVKSDELSSVALLNASGEVVVSAGGPVDLEAKGMMQAGERWGHQRVTVVNVVDLGANVTREGETNRPIIVFPRRDPTNSPRAELGTNESGATNLASSRRDFPGGPRDDDRFGPRLDPGTNTAGASNAVSGDPSGTNAGRRSGGPRQGRPPPWNEQEYQSLLERRGLHGLVIVMSTEGFRRAGGQDLWMRCIIGGFAGISVLGLGLAWRNLGKSSELQLRLLRASEMNSHLKQMNLAAAGLAHETRNPLNIIRGLAQMVSKEPKTGPEVREKLCAIVNETDRVTAQLNEFINYSRPREVRRLPVALSAVVGEVVRALNYDIEEKHIRLQTSGDEMTVEADEQLLRQSLFNLLINAVQAVEAGGAIHITMSRRDAAEASLEILDDGPGVSDQNRSEIFKPYFTTNEKGTGLGLAVVQQIVLAHGWEIECVPNQPKGAIFRITHLKLAARS